MTLKCFEHHFTPQNLFCQETSYKPPLFHWRKQNVKIPETDYPRSSQDRMRETLDKGVFTKKEVK